jgi:RNA polymerase sigma factor (sigma-70 family)
MSSAPRRDSPQSDAEAFAQLWAAIRAGHSAEYRQLVGDCTPHLLKVVRRRLDRRLRPRFDSIDFAQAVWLSFVAQLNCLPDFATADELRGYLGQMASHKVIDEIRRQSAGTRRDLSRETALPEGDEEPLPTGQRNTPSQLAIANERLGQLLAGRSAVHQQIIRQKLAGCSVPEIARAVGLSERQVRRVLVSLEAELSHPPHARPANP